jgi:hypothetical protein
MKNLIIILASFAIFGSLLSCNKDSKLEIDDFPNNSFKITKVEQIRQLNTPPFLFEASQNEAGTGMIRVEYEYNNYSPTVAHVSLIDKPEQKYPINFSSNSAGVYSLNRPPKFSFFEKLGTIVNGINKTTIKCKENSISSISFEVNSGLFYEGTSQVRSRNYEFLNGKIKSTTSSIEFSMYPEEGIGDRIGWSKIDQWEGNHLISYSSFTDLGYTALTDERVAEGIFLATALKGKGRETTISLTYSDAPINMPKELIRKINQLLSGILQGPFEDYVFNWQLDFLFPENIFLQKYVEGDYKSYVESLQASDNMVLADWIWSFAHSSFNVLPDQERLISSKRITGRKVVDIINDEPVYETVDSVYTFPYIFDPIAKTLEIAGLKIWYEVVE